MYDVILIRKDANRIMQYISTTLIPYLILNGLLVVVNQSY